MKGTMRLLSTTLCLISLVSGCNADSGRQSSDQRTYSGANTEVTRLDDSVLSQSGKYLATLTDGGKTSVRLAKIQIKTADGSVAYTDSEAYSYRSKTVLLWDGDTLWLYSGDVGRRKYVLEGSEWQKREPTNPPPRIQELTNG